MFFLQSLYLVMESRLRPCCSFIVLDPYATLMKTIVSFFCRKRTVKHVASPRPKKIRHAPTNHRGSPAPLSHLELPQGVVSVYRVAARTVREKAIQYPSVPLCPCTQYGRTFTQLLNQFDHNLHPIICLFIQSVNTL